MSALLPLLAVLATADFGPAQVQAGALGPQAAVEVAARGGGLLVVWHDAQKRAYQAQRWGADGKPRGEPLELGGPGGGLPAVVSCGPGYVVTWTEATRLVAVVLDDAGRAVKTLEEPQHSDPNARPGLACLDGTALVTWTDSSRRQIHGLVLGPAAPKRLVLFADDAPGPLNSTAVATDGAEFLLFFMGTVAQQTGVWALPVRRDGTAATRKPARVWATAALSGSEAPAVASAGPGHYLVAWSAGPNAGVLAARLGAGGRLLDTHPLELSPASASNPTVAAGNGQYQLAWANARPRGCDLEGARVGLEGPPSAVQSLHASTGTAANPRLAFDGTRFTVGFAEAPYEIPSTVPCARGTDVWLRSLGREPVLVTPGPVSQRSPVAAAIGGQYLAAWLDDACPQVAVRAARATAAGALLDAEGLVVHRGQFNRSLAVAGGRSAYLLVWAGQGIFAARVSATGERLDREPLRLGSGGWPQVAWDGDAFLAAWADGNQLLVARVPEAGPADPPSVVARETSGANALALACGPGSCLLSWPQRISYYGFAQVAGVRVIRGKPETLGARPRAFSGNNEGFAGAPVLAWGADRFLLGWNLGPQGLRLGGVNAAGQPLKFSGSPGQGGRASLAFDGSRFAVGWTQGPDAGALRWAYANPDSLERARELGVTGTDLSLAATAGGGLLALWTEGGATEPRRVRMRVLAEHAEPKPTTAHSVPADAFRLSSLMDRARAIAASQRKDGQRPDAELQRLLRLLVARVQKTTGRGKLPVDLETLRLDRDRLSTRPLKWESKEGRRISIGDGNRVGAHDTYWVTRGGDFKAVFGSVLVADGSLRVGALTDSVIVATGDVDLGSVDRGLVVSLGRIKVGQDGSDLDNGRGFPSILVSGGRIDVARARGTVLGAADGVAVEFMGQVVLLNTPARRGAGDAETFRDEQVILDDVPVSPLAATLEVGLEASSSLPARAGVYLYRHGANPPMAWARETGVFEGIAGVLPTELAGLRVGFASEQKVVLRGPSGRVELEPRMPRRPPPADPVLETSSSTEIHVVGVYRSTRADGTVVVDVQRPGVPLLLVLAAYDEVRWDVRLAPGTLLTGVIVGGFHPPSAIVGLDPRTPVVTRIRDYGQAYFMEYPGSERSTGMPVATTVLSPYTSRRPTSVQGAERGDHYRIGPPAPAH